MFPKLFLWSRKSFEIRGWRSRICKHFEITITIYLNSESTIFKTECFFKVVPEGFSDLIHSDNYIIGKKYGGFRNLKEKLEKMFLKVLQMRVLRDRFCQFSRIICQQNTWLHIAIDKCIIGAKMQYVFCGNHLSILAF